MRYLVLLAFFGSGLSSLILENLWVRLLTLVFGGTTLAIVTVLTVFMGGLALGSYLAGRVIARIRRPFRAYGLLEGAVALYAMALPWMLEVLPHVYRWFPEDWPFWAIAAARFVLCIGLLLFPTTCMGATLPLLSQYFVREPDTIGMDVGLLYSVNTYGAVMGALGSGFVLMPLLGTDISLWIVALGLLGLAFSVVAYDIVLERRTGSPEAWTLPQETFSPEVETFERSFRTDDGWEDEALSWGVASRKSLYRKLTPDQQVRFQRVVVGALVVTGASAMVCQVIWSRTLAMIIGSSTYAFTLILSLFLIGLASGAAYGSWLAHRSLDMLRSWTWLLWGTALLVGLGSLFFDSLPPLFVSIALKLPQEIHPVVLFAFKAGIAALPILLPTFLMGTFFPLALSLLSHHGQPVGERVGNLYMFNTLGAIVGSAAAGFLIIPTIGLQHGLALCGMSYALCAVALVWAAHHANRTATSVLALATCVALLLIPRWDQGLMSLGTFRLSVLRTYTYQQAIRYAPVLYYKEGISATVTVEGDKNYRTLKINGKPEASTGGDRATQILIAALPLALHPNPKDAALIGWGSGMTAGAALFFPLRKLIAVELERKVVEASRWMEPWNFRPLRHKALQLRYNDGRNFLATTRQTFDVIISEPSNPWISGVANLFTREYFQLVRQRLRPHGVFCQWVQLYEISSRNVASILRSVHEVFPYVRLFEVSSSDTDTFLIASTKPLSFDLKRLHTVMRSPRYRSLFAKANLTTSYDLLPRFLLGEREIPKLLKQIPAAANTDAHNRLEFTAPLDLVGASAAREDSPFQKAIAAFGRQAHAYLQNAQPPTTPQAKAQHLHAVAMAYLRYGRAADASGYFRRALQIHPDLPEKAFYRRLIRLMRLRETEPPLPNRATVQRALRKHGAALKPWFWKFLKGQHLYEKKRYPSCRTTFRALTQHNAFAASFPQVWYYKGVCAVNTYHPLEAVRAFRQYIQRHRTR